MYPGSPILASTTQGVCSFPYPLLSFITQIVLSTMLWPPVYELSVTFPNLENKIQTKNIPSLNFQASFISVLLLYLSSQRLSFKVLSMLSPFNPHKTGYGPVISLKSLRSCQCLSNTWLCWALPPLDVLTLVDFKNICFSLVICLSYSFLWLCLLSLLK